MAFPSPSAEGPGGFMGVAWVRLLAVALFGSYLAAAVKVGLDNPLLYIAVAGPLVLFVLAKFLWKSEQFAPIAVYLIWFFDIGFGVTTYIMQAIGR